MLVDETLLLQILFYFFQVVYQDTYRIAIQLQHQIRIYLDIVGAGYLLDIIT